MLLWNMHACLVSHTWWRARSKGSTFSAANEAGVPGILTEAGGQGIWRRSDVNLHIDGITRLMRHMGMLAGGALPPKKCQVLENFIWLRSEFDGFYYSDVEVDDSVSQGQILGKITDFQGNKLQTVTAPEREEYCSWSLPSP